MRSIGLSVLWALLWSGTALAATAPVLGSVRLAPAWGATGAVAVIPSLFPALPLPSAQPVLLPAPVRLPEIARLDDVSAKLAADQARGGLEGRALSAAFFDAAPAGGDFSAPAVSGLPAPRVPADYQPVPVTVQETSYSCGVAAGLSVLRYRQAYAGNERSLYKLMGTRRKDGTPPEGIEKGLEHFGLQARVQENMTLEDLRAALRRGDTVILDIQAWRGDEDTPWSQRWDDGHYVVLTGMDEDLAYVMDPSTPERYTYLPLPELLERWHDYESRGGRIRRYLQMGIVVSGGTPLPRPAQPPLPPEPIKMTPGPRHALRPG